MDDGDVYEGGLVDLCQIDLANLATLADSPLTRAIQRLRYEARHPHDALAGFNSAL
jgi:FXSXX-COOH protein